MRYYVIAIEREFASGGREIGEKLAKKLDIPCYSQEILERAAIKLDLPLTDLYHLEESITNSLLYSFSMLADVSTGKSVDLPTSQKLALAESNIIKELALNPCVLVGRGSAGLLYKQEKVLTTFIHADLKMRINKAIKDYGIESKQAESVLRRHDKRRNNYFKTATSMEWRDSNIYHILFNSGRLGIDSIVDILYAAVN